MSEQNIGQHAGHRTRRPSRVALTLVFAAMVGSCSTSDDGESVSPSNTTTETPTTTRSTSAVPTEQDMVSACHDAIEARMASNPTTPGEVMWNTAGVAASATARGYYDVTGTGTLDDRVQTPFSFTCLVEFGPPPVAVDNGFELRP